MFGFGGIDVLTIGAGTRDVFIKSKHFERKSDPHAPAGFDACFPMGAKIPLDSIVLETGGGATNAAVTFKRFGLKTACLCRVGQDENGKAVTASLNKEGIIIRHMQFDKKIQTSYSVILLSGSGHRSILTFRGASNFLDADLASWHKIKPRWIYLTSMGGNKKANNLIFNKAKKFDSHVAWNPGNNELKLGLKTLLPHIKQTDIFLVNREEAAMLTELPPRHLEDIVKKLGNLPRTALAITDGPKGAYMYDSANKTLHYSPALPGKRINTTGAGDAFGSAFTAAYIKNKNLFDAMAAGLINSLGVITHMGAKAGIIKQFPVQKTLKKIRISTITI